jgi:hypothetical protein
MIPERHICIISFSIPTVRLARGFMGQEQQVMIKSKQSGIHLAYIGLAGTDSVLNIYEYTGKIFHPRRITMNGRESELHFGISRRCHPVSCAGPDSARALHFFARWTAQQISSTILICGLCSNSLLRECSRVLPASASSPTRRETRHFNCLHILQRHALASPPSRITCARSFAAARLSTKPDCVMAKNGEVWHALLYPTMTLNSPLDIEGTVFQFICHWLVHITNVLACLDALRSLDIAGVLLARHL